MQRGRLESSEILNLAKLWVNGDKDAFSALYDHFVDNLYRFVYYKVKSVDAEDITELVFIKAWENRKKYNPAKSSFGSWLYTIARNTVIDHYRVSKTVEVLDVNLADHSRISNPVFLAETALTSEKLRSAIDKLPQSYKDIILLKFIEDFDYSEMSVVLGKSEGAIRIMQFRAVRELKSIMDNMGFKS